jgi:superfamily II DNA or RNA helicase
VILRDYQQDCHAAIGQELQTHSSTLAVLPTGCGKTVVFGAVARDWSHGRSLVICPQIELVDQAARKIERMTGERVGIEQAHRASCELGSYRDPYVVASKQTLMAKRNGERRYKRIGDVGIVVVDEADTSITKEFSEILGHFKDRGAKVLGVTATPFRSDGKAMGQLYETCAYKMWIPQAIDLGWLVAPKAVCCQIQSLDLSEVGTKGSRGDFKDGDLARVMEQESVVFEIAEIVARESFVDGRMLRTVVYCATVDEARAVSQRLRDRHGIQSDWVCGDKRLCPAQRRKEVLAALESDDDPLTHVCNVGVLTTGWDCPNLEHIAMARPTRSKRLYTQILGRGTRPLEGTVDFADSTPLLRLAAIAASAKPHFKVTDTCDNTLEHRLCGVADVLGGEPDLVGSDGRKSVADQVADQLRRGETIDVRQAIERARAAEAKRREEEEEQRRKRQAIESRAKYNRVEVDAMGQHGDGAVRGRKRDGFPMPFGKFKGSAIADLPTQYVRTLLAMHEDPKKDFKLYPKLKWHLESELSARRAAQNEPPREMHPSTAAMAAAAAGQPRQQPPAPRPQQPPKPPAPRPFAMDPELAEIEALLLA